MDVEKTIEFILEQQAQAAAIRIQREADVARLDQEVRRVDLRQRRAIRLAVQEARNERRRRRELDTRLELKMDQIASPHLLNEEMVGRLGEKLDKLGDKIDRLVDASLRGNGRPQ